MSTSKQTPLMVQYQGIREKYPDCVLFFRVGDFYEMFEEDAVEVSRLLNLTLTHRSDSKMCGVPYHASKVYISRLLRLGKKIAVCEQVSLPTGKGLTERKVTEVITPGTTVEEDFLDKCSNNYLGAVCSVKKKNKVFVVFSWIDISTADFFVFSWPIEKNNEMLPQELNRIRPRELLVSQIMEKNEVLQSCIKNNSSMVVSVYPDWHFDIKLSYKRLINQFKTANLHCFALDENSPEIVPAGFLIDYASKNSGCDLSQVDSLTVFKDSEYISLDESSQRNLEIVSNLRDGSSQYSLLEVVNKAVTPMGNRLLRNRLFLPLTNSKTIKERQDKIAIFVENKKYCDSLRNLLSGIYDIERLASRIAMDRAHAKDLIALKLSLNSYLLLKKDLVKINYYNKQSLIANEIYELLSKSIADEPSIILTEGNLIKRGWSEELDHLHDVQDNFTSILENYLEEEKQKSGINNLKIKYNRIIGYFIEVTKSNIESVPEYFFRRQSMVNGARFTTNRLGELEKELLSSSEKIIELERQLFLDIRNRLKQHISYFFEISDEIADLDVTLSNALCALQYRWCRPLVDDGNEFEIKKGRHPVVEYHMLSGQFVPNGVDLGKKRFALITGPNMAGKSTFLRQNALIALLAQTGSYVPAEYAHIGIIDKIFCRVGASDNLAKGESTFLVEMTETANILRSATEKSLVIMDEVGRGTSTEDGLSIAWAISEYLMNNVCSKTLFATHYHELTQLKHDLLQFLFLEVLENEKEVIFLKKIKQGISENSYGLHVARLAGVPSFVIERAKSVLNEIQHPFDTVIQTSSEKMEKKNEKKNSAGLFSEEELILDDLLSIDTNNITPLEALQKISEWKKNLMNQ